MSGTSFNRHIPELDGLRGIAIISVVLYHGTPWVQGGWAGVDLFFVLSGYLITRILLAELEAKHCIDLQSFYLKRLLRLAPALIVLLVFAAASLPFIAPSILPSVWPIVVAGCYLMNWNKAFHWLPNSFVDHTWSLAIEEQFYLLWPFCLTALVKREWVLPPMIAGVLAVAIWRSFLVYYGFDDARTYHGFDVRCDGLLIGCCIAVWPVQSNTRRLMGKSWLLPASAFILILLRLSPRYALVQSVGFTVVSLIAGWLLLAVLEIGPLSKALRFPVLMFTGRISYGWYLWHWPILVLTWAYAKPFLGRGLVAVAISYLVACLSYQYVELPFLRMKRLIGTHALSPKLRVGLGTNAREPD